MGKKELLRRKQIILREQERKKALLQEQKKALMQEQEKTLGIIPDFSPESMKRFYQYLDHIKFYFEYGSGGSTYQAYIRPTIKKIYSIEGDPKWIQILHAKGIPENNDRINIIHIDIQVGNNIYSYPGEKSTYQDWIKYTRAFSNLDANSKKEIDFILIDGRFRVACMLNLFNEINTNTIIAFDDFCNREYYHEVKDYYEIIEEIDRMAFFKKRITNAPSQELITKYEHDFR